MSYIIDNTPFGNVGKVYRNSRGNDLHGNSKLGPPIGYKSSYIFIICE